MEHDQLAKPPPSKAQEHGQPDLAAAGPNSPGRFSKGCNVAIS